MNCGAIITYRPLSSLHWHGSTKFTIWNENTVKNAGQKSDVDTLFWCFWAHTGRMDAQRHINKCYSIRWHSHEVAHKHQKLLERRIKCRNFAVAGQCETPCGRTDKVDVDDTENQSFHIQFTAQIVVACVIMKFLCRWKLWETKYFDIFGFD